MQVNNKKYFRFYTDYLKAFNLLSKRQQIKLLNALVEYVENEEIPLNLKGNTQLVFLRLKPIIDGDSLYEKLRNQRKLAGQKGGKSKNKQNCSKVKQNCSKNVAKIVVKKDIFENNNANDKL